MGFLLGLLLKLPGLANGLLGYLNKRADVGLETHKADVAGDTSVNVALVQGYIEEAKIAAATRAADRGSLWTAWMLPTAFGVCMVHFGAVVFDSVPLWGHVIGSWHVAALPGAYPALQQTIIYSVAGVVGTKSVANVVGRIFTKA